MAASAPPMARAEYKQRQMSKLSDILVKYEVTIADANELTALEGYEIVFLCDDSGSMQLSSVPLNERKLGVVDPTRWEELQDTVKTVAEVACCFDDDGIDVYFLNRPPVKNVTSIHDSDLLGAFQKPPRGETPLAETLRAVLNEKRSSERPLLVLIATDGEPTGGPAKLQRLIKSVINDKHKGICKFQILAVTADDEQLEWINDFDDKFYEVDATDDYYSERAEILATGRVNKFTKGDWIMKALLGPILRKFDEWDEAPKKTLPPPTFNRCAYQNQYPVQFNSHSHRVQQSNQDECCTLM